MLRFANQGLFILLWIVPLLALFYWYVFRKKNQAIQRFGSPELMEKLMSGTRRRRQHMKSVLMVICAGLLLFSLTRPQVGTRLEEVKREGQDIIVAIDVSKSMLAEDIRPSRLEKAKREISRIIDKLQGDRIGIIPFAGEAFVQCPLTLDYGAAKLLLSVINVDLIPVPGTNVSAAIKKAIETFEQKERKHKILILITDGEDHEGKAEEFAEAAAIEGIVIYTVGIGTPEGVPIPDYDESGNRIGYKKDRDGQTVVSKLDSYTLEKIALTTSGKYYNATPEESELDLIYEAISSGEKKELGSMNFTQFEDRFQAVLILFLVVALSEFFLSEKVRLKKEWEGRFR
ncbi:MAG: VWA domain-containing protein [bacterium]|nr:VWA domain-containing protein [bacterium]